MYFKFELSLAEVRLFSVYMNSTSCMNMSWVEKNGIDSNHIIALRPLAIVTSESKTPLSSFIHFIIRNFSQFRPPFRPPLRPPWSEVREREAEMWRDAEGGSTSTMRMEEALARGLQRQLLEEQQQRAVKQKAAQATRKTIDMTWATRVDFHKLASVKLYIIYYILLLCVHIHTHIYIYIVNFPAGMMLVP